MRNKIIKYIILITFTYLLACSNSKKEEKNLKEKYHSVSFLLFYLDENKNDTIIISNFNELYRNLFLSKINDSIISFISNFPNSMHSDCMMIICPHQIHIFEAPDFYASLLVNELDLLYKYYGKYEKYDSSLNEHIDLLFKQKNPNFFRFIGISKKRSNRIYFADSFNNFYTTGSFCYVRTIKNNIIDMKKYKFINDYKEDRKFIFWRLKFPENMVNQDSIAPRIKRILNCKDTIDRRTMFDIGE